MEVVEGIKVNDDEYDFNASGRGGECYAKTGKTVGESIVEANRKLFSGQNIVFLYPLGKKDGKELFSLL